MINFLAIDITERVFILYLLLEVPYYSQGLALPPPIHKLLPINWRQDRCIELWFIVARSDSYIFYSAQKNVLPHFSRKDRKCPWFHFHFCYFYFLIYVLFVLYTEKRSKVNENEKIRKNNSLPHHESIVALVFSLSW